MPRVAQSLKAVDSKGRLMAIHQQGDRCVSDVDHRTAALTDEQEQDSSDACIQWTAPTLSPSIHDGPELLRFIDVRVSPDGKVARHIAGDGSDHIRAGAGRGCQCTGLATNAAERARSDHRLPRPAFTRAGRNQESSEAERQVVIVEPISERLRDASRANQTRRHEIGPQYVQDDLRQAGYRIVRFEEEFTRRPYGETEWIIVAVPDAGQSSDTEPPPRAADVEDWEAASIRIGVEAARRLFESGKAVFIDVRNRPMFEGGRIVGAKLVPLPKVESEISGLVKLGKRLIMYCS